MALSEPNGDWGEKNRPRKKWLCVAIAGRIAFTMSLRLDVPVRVRNQLEGGQPFIEGLPLPTRCVLESEAPSVVTP